MARIWNVLRQAKVETHDGLEAFSGTLDEVRAIAEGSGHPDFPLLRQGYSPASRYPAADFTPWIKKCLHANRLDAIGELLSELTAGNPGLFTGGDGAEYWRAFGKRLASADMSKAILCTDRAGMEDLHAALFPFALHAPLNGFMLLSQHVEYLAKTMAPFAFTVSNLEAKVRSANLFAEQMREETREHSRAWTDFPSLDAGQIQRTLEKGLPVESLASKLRGLTIGARVYFVGTASSGLGQGGWAARPYGVSEQRSIEELVGAGLGANLNEPNLILSQYRKSDLVAAIRGHQIKEEWTKKKFIEFILQEAPEVATSLCEGKSVFEIAPEWKDGALALNGRSKDITLSIAVAVGFSGLTAE